MKKFYPFIILIFLIGFHGLFAQTPSRINIRGILQDTSGAEVITATVMLLDPADSTLVSFTASDKTGGFRFNNVRNDAYLLKVSHVAYMPLQQRIERSSTSDVDLGVVSLTPFSQVLMQVVVRDAKAPIRIHGDTVEYDVSTFRVPPGSTVEDLLRRLPGIEVDASGNISAQGKDVKRVYVDGKTFFGDDPKTVTQNLGSEALSKVQVYDERTEQSRLTGVPDASKDKAMNLELKEEYKKGSFGKVSVAGGTQERWAGRGNYNRFDEKRQLSFIGYANNINQSGVNWDDYREFKGQTGFNDYDNGDFGFSSGGMMRNFSVHDAPINRDSDRGLSSNYGAGTNYNYDNKKTRFNASYFYSESTLWLDQFSDRQTFLPDSSYRTRDTLGMADFRGNHALSSRVEHEIDSLTQLIARVNINVIPTITSTLKNEWYSSEGNTLVNHLMTDNENENFSTRMNGMAIYAKKFKKPGKAFAVSGAANYSSTGMEESLNSVNRFFSATDFEEQIRQLNDDISMSRVLKSSMMYSDGIGKKFFIQGFYNFNTTLQEKENEVTNPLLSGEPRVDSLSLYYRNGVMYNRAGTLLRYSNKGTNASVGVALQNLDIEGAYAGIRGEPWITEPITRSFLSIIPNVSIMQQFKNGMWMQSDYTYEVNAPAMSDLLPRPVINNPLFVNEGNPDLEPEKFHNLSGSIHYWGPSNFASFGANVSYFLYDSRIVRSMVTEFVDSIGFRTTSRPENIAGGDNLTTWVWASLPIIKTILTVNFNGSYRTGSSSAYINSVLNETGNQGYSAGLGLNLTPGSKLLLSFNGRLGFNEITYSIQEEQNQNIETHSASATIRYQFITKTFFESNFNYNLYRNDRFEFEQSVPLWNASVRRILGEKNRFEVRFAAFDIFNKRIGISQSGAQNYIIQTTANTLARYYMLSVSYNIRGYDVKASQKRRHFF
ncbi:MAG: TonB-dependent receptor [Bacteroidales bacterium]